GSAYGLENDPFLFNANLRYAVPALALGIVLVPLVPWLRRPARVPWAVVLMTLLVVATEPSAAGSFTAWPAAHRTAALAFAGTLLLGIGAWIVLRPGRRAAMALTLAVAALAVAGGYKVQQRYLDRRYTTT